MTSPCRRLRAYPETRRQPHGRGRRAGTAAECLGGGDRDIHGVLREAPTEPSPAKPQHQPTAVGKLLREPDPNAAPDLHFTLVGSIPQSRPQGGRRPHAAAASPVGALLQPDTRASAPKPDTHFSLQNGVAIGRQHGGRRHIAGSHITSVGRALREELNAAPRKVEALRWPPGPPPAAAPPAAAAPARRAAAPPAAAPPAAAPAPAEAFCSDRARRVSSGARAGPCSRRRSRSRCSDCATTSADAGEGP